MVLLDDFGGFILILAIIGFLVKDAFYLPRRLMLTEPYDINKSSSNMLPNVALAVALVSAIWYLIAMSISSNPEPANNLFISIDELIQKMLTSNLLTQKEVEVIYKSVMQGMIILTALSMIYLLSFGVISLIGLIYELSTQKAINISFDCEKEEVYRRVLFESSDLIYLQRVDKPLEWVALKKDNISKVESTMDKSLMEVTLNLANSRFNKKDKSNLKDLPESIDDE
ncbi:hypothetical protein [Methanolobus sp. WCC4]|uniref:hypothetical protein n=1 Tax=Methanolobus sp. WCC4 TaxID=3125784 RepID=UPI0030FC5FD7